MNECKYRKGDAHSSAKSPFEILKGTVRALCWESKLAGSYLICRSELQIEKYWYKNKDEDKRHWNECKCNEGVLSTIVVDFHLA